MFCNIHDKERQERLYLSQPSSSQADCVGGLEQSLLDMP